MKIILRMTALIITAALLTGAVAVAAEQQDFQNSDFGRIDYLRQTTYSSYYEQYNNQKRPEQQILLDASSISGFKNASVKNQYNDHNQAVVFSQNGGYVEYTAEIPQGVYTLEVAYTAKTDNHTELEIGVMIDGKYPFDDAQVVSLSRAWKDSDKIKQDENGNDILPIQQEISLWSSEKLFDRQGFYEEPYLFYFKGGTHTVRITCEQDNVVLGEIRIANHPSVISYQEYKDQNTSQDKGKTIFLEAEQTSLKSHSTLYPTIDRTSSLSSPADAVKLKYNTIGQSNFSHSGQWMEWEVMAEKSGNYHISFRARQNLARGINSKRTIYIDNRILFKELEEVSFPFASKFYFKTLGDDAPFDIYLEAGRHTIRMEVAAPEVSKVMRVVNDMVFELNTIYRQLMMIVGPNPDTFRDYYVEKEIPDLLPRLKNISTRLEEQHQYLDTISSKKAGNASDIQQMYVMLDSMIKKPETIPFRMQAFQTNISSLSAWISSVSAQPLELDYLLLTQSGELPGKAEGSFLSNFFFGLKSVIGSYFEDYSALGGEKQKGSVNVWVGLGRDQAQVIKQMTDSYFTPQTGIKVNLSLVQGSILEATLAGKGPDVSLFVGDGLPMNLAARGALTGLSQYADLSDMALRFNDGAMTPYIFGNDYYGLPLTQSFPVMFYRKDVLSELGIQTLPQTWEAFYKIIPVLQRANLTVGMGDTNVMQYGVNQSPNFGFVFPSLLFQRGGYFYHDDLSATRFDEEVAIQAFCDWTELYTQYSLSLEYDLFNRFRTGEMPLAFAPYTTYNQINYAAPEIKGLWGIAPVPGTLDKDGKLHREAAASGSSGAVIFKKAQDERSCYEYIKWLTSDEMQVVYGRNIESLMGPAARYDTANKSALYELPWSIGEQKILSQQRTFVKEVPVVPATYYVNREVTNAFRRVVLKIQNPRETLILFNRSINKEIRRKNQELMISSRQEGE